MTATRSESRLEQRSGARKVVLKRSSFSCGLGHAVFVPLIFILLLRSLLPGGQPAMLDAYYIPLFMFEGIVELGCRGVGYPG